MEREFIEWFEENEKWFTFAQLSKKNIAHSAWLEGKKMNNNEMPHIMQNFQNGFVIDFIPSYAIQRGNPKLLIHPDDMPEDKSKLKEK